MKEDIGSFLKLASQLSALINIIRALDWVVDCLSQLPL